MIEAYDKAVNMAKEEVAKRIARDTQGQQLKQKSQSSKHLNQMKKSFKVCTLLDVLCTSYFPLYYFIVSPYNFTLYFIYCKK